MPQPELGVGVVVPVVPTVAVPEVLVVLVFTPPVLVAAGVALVVAATPLVVVAVLLVAVELIAVSPPADDVEGVPLVRLCVAPVPPTPVTAAPAVVEVASVPKAEPVAVEVVAVSFEGPPQPTLNATAIAEGRPWLQSKTLIGTSIDELSSSVGDVRNCAGRGCPSVHRLAMRQFVAAPTETRQVYRRYPLSPAEHR